MRKMTKLRKKLGVNMNECAQMLGISHASVAKYKSLIPKKGFEDMEKPIANYGKTKQQKSKQNKNRRKFTRNKL